MITSQGIERKTPFQMMGTSSDFRLKNDRCVKPDRPPASSAEAPLYAFSLGTLETGFCLKGTGDISAAVRRCGPLWYDIPHHHVFRWYVLGAFAKLQKPTVTFVMSVRMEQVGCHWTDFHEIWYFISLKPDKNNTYFRWRIIYPYDSISL